MTIPLFLLVLLPSAPSATGAPRRRIPLTLEDCLVRALRYEANLEAATHLAAAAEARIEEAHGIFDPVSNTQARWTDEKTPEQPVQVGPQSFDQESDQVDIFASTGVSQALATGGTFDVLFQANRFRSRFTTLNTLVTPAVADVEHIEFATTSLNLSIRQPLLRGGWTSIGLEPVRRAELERDAAVADRAVAEQTLLYDVHVAYWNLVFTRDDREVKQLSLSLAERLLEINRRKVEVGASAPVEVYQAETEIAMRKEALITSDHAILAAEDRLKALLYPFVERGEWDFEIVPSTEPPPASSGPLPAWEDIFEKARESRPDLRKARAEVARAELALHAAENGTLPRLDLEGRIGTAGTDDRIRQTFDDTFSNDFPNHSVGLVLSFPFGNVGPRAREAAAREDLAAARVSLRGLENTVAEETRAAVRQLHFLLEKQEASRKSRELAKRQLDAGEVKFDAGAATNYEVLGLQEDLAEAMTNEKLTILTHAKALANLEKVQGILQP